MSLFLALCKNVLCSGMYSGVCVKSSMIGYLHSDGANPGNMEETLIQI